jgi:SAM-dependent methyltransferase
MNRDRWFEVAFDEPYLEVYAHRNQEEADRATRQLLEPFGIRNRWVVDLACGAGRWLLPLERAGARAIGVDLSWPLLQRAAALRQRHGASFALLRADMQHVPLQRWSCDIVLSMFTSFGYFHDVEGDLAVLREARRLLRPTGALFLDVFNGRRLRQHLVPQSQRTAGRFEVLETRQIDAQRDVVIKDIVLSAAGETFRYREQVRLWEEAALCQALRDSGFHPSAVFGDYDATPFVADSSPRLIVRAAATEAPTRP